MRGKHGCIAIAAAAAAAALAVGGCGTAAPVSTLDPAAAVPADVPIYISADVRPSRSQTNTLKTIVDEFGGRDAWSKLIAEANIKLSKHGANFASEVEPWLGQRVGVAFTSIPTRAELNSTTVPSDFVVIFPTSNPSEAKSSIEKLLMHRAATTIEARGNYVLVGGAAAVQAAESATSTLASTAAYKDDTPTRSAAVADVYVQLKPLVRELESQPAYASLLKDASVSSELKNLPADASVTAALKAATHAVSLDILPHDVPAQGGAGGASVGGLPGDSIIALALTFTKSSFEKVSQQLAAGANSGLASGLASARGLPLNGATLSRAKALAHRALGVFTKTVFPALGPLELSLGGTSLSTLRAGVSIASFNQAAATRLLALLYRKLSGGGRLPVTRTAGGGFTLSLPPSFSVIVSHTDGKILGLLGYTSAADFLTPSSALSANSTYKTALSELPSGSSNPFFVNFGPLDQLLAAIGPAADSISRLGQVEAAITHLSYVILGSSSGDTRLVVGLK